MGDSYICLFLFRLLLPVMSCYFVSVERNRASGRADLASRRDLRQAPAAVKNEQQYANSMTHTHLIPTSLRTYLG